LNISFWEEKSISPTENGTFESMIFLFPWWDMLVPWRVSILDKLHHPLVAQFCNKHSREDDIQYTIDWTTCPPPSGSDHMTWDIVLIRQPWMFLNPSWMSWNQVAYYFEIKCDPVPNSCEHLGTTSALCSINILKFYDFKVSKCN